MKRKISFIFIIIGFIGIQIVMVTTLFQKFTNEQIVNQIKMNNYDIKKYYVGYIELCSLKIPLVYGTSNKELNQNLVGISNHSTKNHLILAGHAISSVFLCLHNINLNEQIIINFHDFNNIYYIDSKIVVQYNDTSIYNNIGLTLITCIDNYKRLIIHAKTAN